MEHHQAPGTFDAVAERFGRRRTAAGLGRIALTTASFLASPRQKPYRQVRKAIHHQSRDQPPAAQLIHPEIDEVRSRVDELLSRHQPTADLSLSLAQQTMFVCAMYQFSDRNSVAASMATQAAQIRGLHEQIASEAQLQPVTVDRQLDIALQQNDSLFDAVWTLFLTTRQNARWRDSRAISGELGVEPPDVIDHMMQWERSLVGYKAADTQGYQDRAGDSYYVWTHALAKTLYSQPVAGDSPLTRFYRLMFESGSKIMSLTHKLSSLSALGTMSDHVVAGQYGNAIGDSLVSYIEHHTIDDQRG